MLFRSRVKSYEEFKSEIIAYVNFHHEQVFGMPMYGDLALYAGKKFLEDNTSGGWRIAVEIGMSGDKGGMGYLFTAISIGFQKDSENKYLGYTIRKQLSSKGHTAIKEGLEELRKKFDDYTPEGFEICPVEVMMSDFEMCIRAYLKTVGLLNRVRDFTILESQDEKRQLL